GGATRAQIAAQQATLESAQASYHGAVLNALGDVEDSLVALDRGGERVAALERAAEAAANAAELARARYRSGLIDFGTLLDAERSLLSARSSLASARTDLALAGVRLYKGLGGGWSAEATRP
ncbi:TolC family protein, partial [Rubrivivax gelatinosus]